MMAHMVSCTFTGGPFDGTVREVNSLKNEVEFDKALNPRPIPPIAEDAVMPEIVGALGTPGVTLTAADHGPGPMRLTARTMMLTSVPLASPVMVRGLTAEAGGRVMGVAPPFREYS